MYSLRHLRIAADHSVWQKTKWRRSLVLTELAAAIRHQWFSLVFFSLAMANSKAQVRSRRWRQTVSGVTLATLGLQGTAANAVDAPSTMPPAEGSVDELMAVAEASPAIVEPKTREPEVSLIPRFSTVGWPHLRSTGRQEAPVSLSVERLKQHRRELHRRSNEVESQLLTIQQLLSMQSYGTSFADKLLSEDEFLST